MTTKIFGEISGETDISPLIKVFMYTKSHPFKIYSYASFDMSTQFTTLQVPETFPVSVSVVNTDPLP